MTPELKHKTQRVGTLLAQSPLDEEIKKAIVDNFDRMTEIQLDQILKSLEREVVELVSLEKVLKEFNHEQELDWKKLEEDQKRSADKLIEETVRQTN